MSATINIDTWPHPCCPKERIVDLTHGYGEERNYYCHSCRAHLWKGKFYTHREWEAWINEGVDNEQP